MPTSRSRWLADAAIRDMALKGASLEEIALANETYSGWKPTRGTISKKLSDLGLPPRYGTRKDLLPREWHVRPEDMAHRYRFWLSAESKRRAGDRLTAADQRALDLMFNVLTGRGVDLVIGYHQEIGWYLTDRTDEDNDIIRSPLDDDDDCDLAAGLVVVR